MNPPVARAEDNDPTWSWRRVRLGRARAQCCHCPAREFREIVVRMEGGDGVGRRIATYRRRRGLSQAALAGLVGRSESWLSQVERGVRSVDRMSVLLDLARVLHVEVEALIGRPWQLAPNGGVIAGDFSDLRAVLTSYSSLLGRPYVHVTDLAELRARVAEMHRTYQAARYDDVMSALPAVLAAVEEFPGRKNGQRREALLAYVSAY